jgi:uncharacterized membrane protein
MRIFVPTRGVSVLRTLILAVAASLLAPSDIRAAETKILANHVPPAVSRARKLGPLSAGSELRLSIGLPLRNTEQLDLLLTEIADPASPNYRAWLTSDQFTRRFGPTETDYLAVTAFAESHGLKVTATHPNRMILDVSGRVADIEAAFNTGMFAWSESSLVNSNARASFYAPDREPSVPGDLPILDISGLDNYVLPRPMSLKVQPASVAPDSATGSGPAGLLTGGDFRSAYAPGVKLTGAGQTIGLFELDGFYAGDVQANFSAAGLPAVPVQTVLLDGFNGSPGAGNIEVMLDIMMAAYMAPGAKIIVYEGLNWNDVLNRMATDNLARQLSSSWGFSPINSTTEQIFRQYMAQGQSMFQASGDSGAYSGGIMPPSDDPNLTVVGGTHLATSGPGGSWLNETAWPGSGGGVSRTYSIPAYQQGVKMSSVGGSTTMRNIPDVALTADVQMFLIQNNGQGVSVGGTSAAAPLWAGFLALANQQAATKGAPPIGFLNPALYSLGEGTHYTSSMHDIIAGSNGFSTMPGFDLVTGWGSPSGQGLIDQLTGTQTAASFSLAASPASISIAPGATASSSISITPAGGFSGAVALTVSGLPVGLTASFSSATAAASSTLTFSAATAAAVGTATVTVTGASGGLTSTFTITLRVTSPSGFTLTASPATLGLVQGNSAKSTITINNTNGFSGTVNLSVSGVPSGVTAALSRGATGNTLALTLGAGASAPVGSFNVVVTGASGSVTETATIALSVTAVPGFSLTASPASVSVAPGASAASSISVVPLNNFNSSVALSVTGLPAGVTAVFSQPEKTGASTLTFSAGSTAPAGTASVTVTGISGSQSKTTTINLTVAGTPAFTISASPASLTLMAGTTGSSTIAIGSQNGFAGKVNLTASGLPTGVTASFGTPSTLSGSTIAFTVAGNASSGAATVTITGTSGSMSKTTTVSLTVLPAADFSISFPQGSLNIVQGTLGTGIVRTTALGGFNGTVAMAASGLPSGVTATFSPGATAGLTAVAFTVPAASAKGSFSVTITGSSGNLSHRASLTLNILAPAPGTAVVSLALAANISAAAIDSLPFTGGGLDNGGRSYSGLLLGASQTIGAITYSLAPMTGSSAVNSKTVPLPSGQFGALKLLATGLNGNQPAQTFTVNYTDGSKSTFAQSLSDWFTPQNYPGESTGLMMPYRDNSTGTIDGRTFLLYEYSFNLAPGKTVSSVVLPNNRNVAVLAMTLTGAASQAK